MRKIPTAEHIRLADSESRKADWKNWGPYLSERAWGTVREDYSFNGDAWEYFPHDHARSRTYRWNEDGLGGFCNRFQNICLAVALWNERDPILKERLFGVSGNQGNHGEDVKELYYYLDNTPTHSYAKMLYKYPQVPYPYQQLIDGNRKRNRLEPEYELFDELSNVFAEGRYFDVIIEYAKADQEDILCRISVINRGPESAPIHVLPHIWFRNTWSWGYDRPKPELRALDDCTIYSDHRYLGERWWYIETDQLQFGSDGPNLLFTENTTNFERLYDEPNLVPYVKDGINNAVVHGQNEKVNPEMWGTKAAAHFKRDVPSGELITVRLRFSNQQNESPFNDFDSIFSQRLQEADDFYQSIRNPNLSVDEVNVQRQAFAGLLWTKQFYHYSVELWLDGDPVGPTPPDSRKLGRNRGWDHIYNLDVISMPDKWEYPWYAAWDLAFHTIPIAMIDPEWAKRQLILFLREWYMHPNGQIPAYEWALGDVNPPVHAWAALRVYEITRETSGYADTEFLEQVFQKLLLNFTWWVNRKDSDDNNLFQGGFLGLDNIGVFNRSEDLPVSGYLEQADGTAWMGMYCLNMLAIAIELAQTRPSYEDMASKFLEHFIYISNAIHNFGMWNQEDGFFYDLLHSPIHRRLPLKIRSFVGLIPLFAVEAIDPDVFEKLPKFKKRMDWFIKNRPHLLENMASLTKRGTCGRYLLSLVDTEKLKQVMFHMLDEKKFLSDFGLRSLSKEHLKNPFTFAVGEKKFFVQYVPGESDSGMFGGNSNWRGPIWFPINYLMIESLHKYYRFFGDNLKIEMPTASGNYETLNDIASNLSNRLISIFLRDQDGNRAYNGDNPILNKDPHWRENILFHEYFHGDSGLGLGASHQTGWTALVATLINDI